MPSTGATHSGTAAPIVRMQQISPAPQQAPPQQVSPLSHVVEQGCATQEPAQKGVSPSHSPPHIPQLNGSFARFTH